MYLKKIELHNIRGFESLVFDLTRPDGSYAGWTVFTGDNGAGKSSLLKAIAVGLTGKETARALQPNFQRWVRDGASEGRIALTIDPERGVDEFSVGGRTAYKPFPATVNFDAKDRDTRLEMEESQKSARRGLWATDSRGWFSCGYGPFRRVFGASSEAMRLMVGATTERFVTMFQEAASLAEVDQWLRSLSHKKLENRATETAHLELLVEMLRDELMPNQITVERVDSDGLWLKDRNGLQLAWNDMSDGYRAALALLADILRHLINAYGIEGLAERAEDGKLRIVKGGVVMVDEIDAHLHPQWQREIGFWLKKHFPKIQFLVTTHSPIICQAADANGLFVLPAPGGTDKPRALSQADYEKVIASRPDEILLTPAFGLQNTRSPRAVEGRAAYARLKSKERGGGKLSKEEQVQVGQLKLFAESAEDQ